MDKNSRLFCIGRNYVAHARELSSKLPSAPVVFMKPGTCLVAPGEPVRFPAHGTELHHEVELVVRIGKQGKNIQPKQALSCISAWSVGLDLTLRDVQDMLKDRGLPWEVSKAFDQSAPVGEFVPYNDQVDLQSIGLECRVNGQIRQQGNTRDMIFPVPQLISHLSCIWTLFPGDLIYTGTPAGVGPLLPGETIEITGDSIGPYAWKMVR